MKVSAVFENEKITDVQFTDRKWFRELLRYFVTDFGLKIIIQTILPELTVIHAKTHQYRYRANTYLELISLPIPVPPPPPPPQVPLWYSFVP